MLTPTNHNDPTMPSTTDRKTVKAATAALDAAAAAPTVKNAPWSNNNAACWFTWFCLSKKTLGQIDASFPDAETIKMGDLANFNELAPDDNREAEARALADVLTKLFTNMLGATYEKGHDYASALAALMAILSDAKKTVAELAAVVDELHHFSMEKNS